MGKKRNCIPGRITDCVDLDKNKEIKINAACCLENPRFRGSKNPSLIAIKFPYWSNKICIAEEAKKLLTKLDSSTIEAEMLNDSSATNKQIRNQENNSALTVRPREGPGPQGQLRTHEKGCQSLAHYFMHHDQPTPQAPPAKRSRWGPNAFR